MRTERIAALLGDGRRLSSSPPPPPSRTRAGIATHDSPAAKLSQIKTAIKQPRSFLEKNCASLCPFAPLHCRPSDQKYLDASKEAEPGSPFRLHIETAKGGRRGKAYLRRAAQSGPGDTHRASPPNVSPITNPLRKARREFQADASVPAFKTPRAARRATLSYRRSGVWGSSYPRRMVANGNCAVAAHHPMGSTCLRYHRRSDPCREKIHPSAETVEGSLGHADIATHAFGDGASIPRKV